MQNIHTALDQPFATEITSNGQFIDNQGYHEAI